MAVGVGATTKGFSAIARVPGFSGVATELAAGATAACLTGSAFFAGAGAAAFCSTFGCTAASKASARLARPEVGALAGLWTVADGSEGVSVPPALGTAGAVVAGVAVACGLVGVVTAGAGDGWGERFFAIALMTRVVSVSRATQRG